MSKDKNLHRVIITRVEKGWDVIRERVKSGEAAGPFDTLDEAFGYVQAVYDDNGVPKVRGIKTEDGDEDEKSS